MSDPFRRTETALEECQEHLSASSAFGSPIESYLTQHILVIMCAEMQQALYSAVESRAASAGDVTLARFVSDSARRLVRSIKTTELAGNVDTFGADCKTQFHSCLLDSQVTLYNNAVADRHTVAHVSSVTVTFAQLHDALEAARRILDAFETSIQA